MGVFVLLKADMKASLFLFVALVGLIGCSSAGTVFTLSNYPEWYNWYASESYLENWYWAGENSFFDYVYSTFFQVYSSFTFTYYEAPTFEEPTTYWSTGVQSTFATSNLSSSSDAFVLIPSTVAAALSIFALI